MDMATSTPDFSIALGDPPKFKYRLRRALYSNLFEGGNRYYCVFCGKNFSRFYHIGKRRPVYKKYDVVGAGRRENAGCPNCFSCDRARMVYLFLKTQTDLFDKPKRVLHVAPNPHLATTLYHAQNIEYSCGELYPDGKFGAIEFDVRDLPWEDNYFDLVMCNHVLVMVPDEDKGFQEIHRVLKPGGFALVQGPIGFRLEQSVECLDQMSRRESIQRFGCTGCVRIYGKDYAQMLSKLGFEVSVRNAFKERWLEDIERHGLDKREDLFVCTKPGV